MTSGQIKLISTAQGLGVRAAGDMAANTSNANIDSHGNVYGQQNVGIVSSGTVATTGTVKAQQGVAISVSGDGNLGDFIQAGNNLTVNAGDNLTGSGNLAATKAIATTAANRSNLRRGGKFLRGLHRSHRRSLEEAPVQVPLEV